MEESFLNNEDNEWKRPSPLEIWRMTESDRTLGGFPTKAAISGMVAGLAVEWLGPNEWMLGTTGSDTLRATHNIYETGAATGSVSFMIQATVGTAVALTVNRCPEAIEKLSNRLKRPNETEENKKSTDGFSQNISTHVLRPLIGGSGINLAIEAPKSESKSLSLNMRKVLGWSAVVGAGVFCVGTGGAQLVVEGQQHGFESFANVVVNDVLPNPLSYVAIAGIAFGVGKSIKLIKNKITSSRNNKVNNLDGIEQSDILS